MKKIATIAGASAMAVALGAGLVSGATAASASPKDQAGKNQNGDRVTGPEAQQAIDAALAAVPGTADHAHRTADGGYVVKVRTGGGNAIIVTLTADFVVTGKQQVTGKRDRTPVTDDEKAKASAAVIAAVPGSTVLEVKKDRDRGYRVFVRTSDGLKKLVKLDSNYTLVSVEDAKGRHAGQGSEVTGENFTKARNGALTAVPGGTVIEVHQKGASYHVLIKKPDGTKACVTLDANFTVTATKEFRVRTKS